MPYSTFTPSISPESASGQTKVRETINEFGDGYEQSVVDGINAVYFESLELSWPVLTYAEEAELRAFFTAQAGKTFLWKYPGETTARKWRCSSWSTSPTRNATSMTATLREVFA